MMADTAWKQFERWVCKVFGGYRDWEHPEECADTGMWAPEAKYRKRLPKWLVGDPEESMMEQAERQARSDQIPFVVLTQHHMKRTDSLAIMRVSDLLYIASLLDSFVPVAELQSEFSEEG